MREICEKCGKSILELLPGLTSQKEIDEFLASSPIYNSTNFQPHELLVVGKYCPNGCTKVEDYDNNGAIDCQIDFAAYEKSLTAKITICVKSIEIEEYKIYIDGNISHIRQRDLNKDECTQFKIEAGSHRIVVREKEVKPVNRLESNTIHFSLTDNEEAKFLFSINGESLILTQQ